VHLRDGKADVTIRRIDAEHGMTYFFEFIEDYALRWVLLLAAGVLLLSLALPKRGKHRS
jgi:hypothetical protein